MAAGPPVKLCAFISQKTPLRMESLMVNMGKGPFRAKSHVFPMKTCKTWPKGSPSKAWTLATLVFLRAGFFPIHLWRSGAGKTLTRGHKTECITRSRKNKADPERAFNRQQNGYTAYPAKTPAHRDMRRRRHRRQPPRAPKP